MPLTASQIDRYSRHILLPDVGSKGQQALLNAKVLYIGAGGLGCPALQYLAVSGVGTLGIMDDDVVEASNLARQILYTEHDIGKQKAVVAAEKLHRFNPDVHCVPTPTRFTENHAALLNDYNIIADGSDNFATRLLLGRLCYTHKKPLVSAAVTGFSIQLMTFKPYAGDDSNSLSNIQDFWTPACAGDSTRVCKNGTNPQQKLGASPLVFKENGGGYPCYQCLYGETPEEAATGNCAENGVLSPIAGIAGTLQATAVIQEILGLGAESGKTLFTFDALTMRGQTVRVAKDPACAVCG
jgi:molybdopterin/thiamine biosynthesis adenylyltransferase